MWLSQVKLIYQSFGNFLFVKDEERRLFSIRSTTFIFLYYQICTIIDLVAFIIHLFDVKNIDIFIMFLYTFIMYKNVILVTGKVDIPIFCINHLIYQIFDLNSNILILIFKIFKQSQIEIHLISIAILFT
ncbi:hypothetical protein ACJX0J_019089 [Zea mays]